MTRALNAPRVIDIDPDDLRLCLHTWPIYIDGNWQDRRCSYCQGPYDGGRQAHIVVGCTSPPTDTALCKGCLDDIGPYGDALRHLRDGIEAIDSACAYAPDERLRTMMSLAIAAVDMVVTTYRERDDDEGEAPGGVVIPFGGRS
jgi:hypothetical protein